MNTEAFEELLNLVTPMLQKKRTSMRKPLTVEEKLARTLRFLATGESYNSINFAYQNLLFHC